MTTLGLRDLAFLAAGQASGAGLTPVDLGAALWLDCYDSSTITDVSGAASQINDKSGNGRNAVQSTAANRPAVTTASGKQVLRFDGSNDFLSIASSFFPSGAPSGVSFIIAAVTNVDATSGWGSIITTSSDYNHNGVILLATSTTRFTFVPPSSLAVLSNVNVSPGLQVVTMVATAGATGTMTAYKNGTQVATGSFTNTVTNSAKTQIGLLAVDTFFDFAKFDLHQLAVVTGTSSTTTRQQLEGWAAWKAGLQGDLPADHPYKNAAP